MSTTECIYYAYAYYANIYRGSEYLQDLLSDMQNARNFTRAGFLKFIFTRKCANYANFLIAKKQRNLIAITMQCNVNNIYIFT